MNAERAASPRTDDDPVALWARIHRLEAQLTGPGDKPWCDIALNEKVSRLKAESELSAAREQVAALEGRNFELESLHGQLSEAFAKTSQRALNAEAALAACRQDAARYQWLKGRFNGETWLEHNLGDICPFKFAGPNTMISDVALDDGIDAAMSAQGPT